MMYLFHINEISYIPLNSTTVIGRVSGDFNFPDGKLSSRHLCVHVETGNGETNYYVEDLGSKNRTTLNRTEIVPNEKKKLKLNSFIEAGNQQFIFTDNRNLSIEEINDIVESNLSKQVKKLEGILLMQDLRNKKLEEIARLTGEENALLESIKSNETEIQNLKEIILNSKLQCDEKIRELEAEKLNIFEDYNLQAASLKGDIEKRLREIEDLHLKASEKHSQALEIKAKLTKSQPEEP